MIARLSFLLVLLLPLPACHLTTKAQAGVTAIATVTTLDAALGQYANWFDTHADALGAKAIEKCHGKKAEFRSCVSAELAPYDRVQKSIEVYVGLRSAGASALDKNFGDALAEVLTAFTAIGWKVTP